MTATAFNAASFRTQFAAFADTAVYPATLLQSWWTMGSAYISTNNGLSWAYTQQQAQFANDLMCAHLIALYNQINIGQTPGLVDAATEGSVNVHLVPPPTKTAFQNWLSQTPYGQQLRALLDLVAGPGLFIGGLPQTGSFRNTGGNFC